MVLVYDDDYDEMMILIDLFVGMNVAMNLKNDVNDYYYYDGDDDVNVIENDFVNVNENVLDYCCYLHYVFLIDYCYYYWNY